MNAIIQCLSNVNRLKNYLLANFEKLLIDKNNDKIVSFSMAKIFKNIWENEEFISKGFYNPTQYKNAILEKIIKFKNKNYKQIQIISFLLNSINEELKNKIILPSIKKQTIALTPKKFNDYYDFYLKEFNKKKTIISDEFCVIIQKNTICQFCKNKEISINQEYYFI